MFKIAALVFVFAVESIALTQAEAATLHKTDAVEASAPDTSDCLVCQFGEPDPSYDCASGAHFDVADGRLIFVCLSDNDFSGASFRNADLSGADFAHAKVDYADFTGANVALASFRGTDLSHAKGLTQKQLAEACGDAETKAPHGLRIRICS